jgi:DNA-binding FadR family transcriptional regulator
MTNSRPSRIPARRVAESVAAELRVRILAPGGAPDAAPDDAGGGGYRLPTQDQLVEEFGVSYPSVREALRILETEGLVTVRRGSLGGAEAHRPDASSAAYHMGLALQGSQVALRDFADGLQMLEPLCAAACARRADRLEAVVPLLRDNVSACAALTGDGPAFTRAAREFHDLLVTLTPNGTVRYVISSLVTLWSAQEESWAEALARRGEYPSAAGAASVVRVHERITSEIEAGNDAAAQRVARSHLAATQALLLEKFGDGVVNAAAVSRLGRPARRTVLQAEFGAAVFRHQVQVVGMLGDPAPDIGTRREHPDALLARGIQREPGQPRGDALSLEPVVNLGMDEVDQMPLIQAVIHDESREVAADVDLKPGFGLVIAQDRCG